MDKYEPQIAAAILALGTFELWKVWSDCAPSLSEARKADPNSSATRRQMYDADIVVGTLAFIIGVSYAILTRKMTVFVLLLVMFFAISFLHHYVLNDNPVED